jgi:hypothetical protein
MTKVAAQKKTFNCTNFFVFNHSPFFISETLQKIGEGEFFEWLIWGGMPDMHIFRFVKTFGLTLLGFQVKKRRTPIIFFLEFSEIFKNFQKFEEYFKCLRSFQEFQKFSGIFWSFSEISRIFRNFIEFLGIFRSSRNFQEYLGIL